jgi:hypothetical protein
VDPKEGAMADRIPAALKPADSSEQGLRAGKSSADRQTTFGVIGLGLVIHMLRSRSLYERAAVAAIVLAALAGLAGLDRESRTKNFKRLMAWVTQQDDVIERKIKEALS